MHELIRTPDAYVSQTTLAFLLHDYNLNDHRVIAGPAGNTLVKMLWARILLATAESRSVLSVVSRRQFDGQFRVE